MKTKISENNYYLTLYFMIFFNLLIHDPGFLKNGFETNITGKSKIWCTSASHGYPYKVEKLNFKEYVQMPTVQYSPRPK